MKMLTAVILCGSLTLVTLSGAQRPGNVQYLEAAKLRLENAIIEEAGVPRQGLQAIDSNGKCVPLWTALRPQEIFGTRMLSAAALTQLAHDLRPKVEACRRIPDLLLLSGSHAKDVEHTSGAASNSSGHGSRISDIPPRVWLSSTVAIIIISAVGLLGVAIVPLVQKVFYNHVLQFLVALAIGTLAGDAMLHLLPHAISASVSDGEDHEKERQAILKGLAALGGVYFFFIAEKLVALISEGRAEKKAEEEEREKARRASRKPSTINDWRQEEARRRRSRCEVVGHLPLSSTSCEDMVVVGLSSQAMKSIGTLQRYRESEIDVDLVEDDADSGDENTTERSKLTNNDHRLSVPARVDYQSESYSGERQSLAVKIVLPSATPSAEKEPEEEEVKIRRPKRKESTDSKKAVARKVHDKEHGHSHDVPDSIASVAWMVILGDGLHNFTDGLAIGAAFAKNFTGGLSTSIAVFCHELPHELGDFAVLLKTGMSVKQAIFYNLVSSILCFFGMLIGVALGNVGSASYWILAITGGIFIYISLVDMLPELGSISAKPGESRITHFVLQNFGILTGVGIMLLIALFEENIKDVFG